MIKKQNNILFSAVLILGPLITFSIIAVVLIFENNADLALLPLVPILYYIIYIKIAKIHELFMFPAIGILNLICYIRYLIIPVLYVICLGEKATPDNIQSGLVFYIYEEITVGFLIVYLSKYKYSKLVKNDIKSTEYEKNNGLDSRIPLPLVLICFYALYLIIRQPIYVNEYHFVFFNDTVSLDVQYGDGNTLIIELAKIVIPVILTAFFCEQYQKKRKNTYYFMTIIIVLFFNVLIVKALSRNTVIFPAIASIYFLIRIFPHKKKTTLIIIGGISFISLITLTIVKSNYGSGSYAIKDVCSFLSTLQNYYMGPDELSLALTAKSELSSSFTIYTALNDLFYNVPGISRFFNGFDRTNTLFNAVKGTQSHVIPLIGQGAFYFGYAFSFLLNYVCIWIVSNIDLNYYKARSTIELYICSYFAITLMHSSLHNISNYSAIFWGRALPLIIIITLHAFFRGGVSKSAIVKKRS